MRKDNQQYIIKKQNEFIYKGKIFQYYGQVLLNLREKNKNIYVVVSDLSKNTPLDDIHHSFGDHFINVGISEQNLIGVSAGLASEGNHVFTQTHSAFLVGRAFEFIRNLIGYDKKNVILLGYASGFSTGYAGFTHWAIGDLAILRTIPNIRILCPSDIFETAKSIAFAYDIGGPVYIRIPSPYFVPGFISKREISYEGFRKFGVGKKLLIISYGYPLKHCLEAVIEKKWEQEVTIIDNYLFHPINEKGMVSLCIEYQNILVVEDHIRIGGLYSILTDLFSRKGVDAVLNSISIASEEFPIGDQEYLYDFYNLTIEKIQNRIGELIS